MELLYIRTGGLCVKVLMACKERPGLHNTVRTHKIYTHKSITILSIVGKLVSMLWYMAKSTDEQQQQQQECTLYCIWFIYLYILCSQVYFAQFHLHTTYLSRYCSYHKIMYLMLLNEDIDVSINIVGVSYYISSMRIACLFVFQTINIACKIQII